MKKTGKRKPDTGKKKPKASTAGPPFPYDPSHPEGTCSQCGEEMAFVAPRLGSGAGFVHKATRRFGCPDRAPGLPQPAVKTS